ncbi:SCP-like extracellular protein [Staphylococcus felis]|uniref:CAP-associated domain-containing protein n=1 Tax=Staphylococcus felis TaxID=46127 RepID=UPI000E268FD2|nr:CAP-associated domain-containing protein [Staphylococcus felis]REH96089.1 SCP-like extracellular protein [Staphylococcus felis]REI02051.1 SCP-like extracellular protein [Staphylococcus felis]REI20695.1 SCP-like extracellular protein [Staphylococcus felis]REI34743.1 SCP-like extracellular protein [Staphylococcus felis]
MKSLIIKIIGIMLLVVFLVYLFYSPQLEFDVLENPNRSTSKTDHNDKAPQSNQNMNPKITSGLGTLIGKPMDKVTEKLGQADRTYHYMKKYKTFIFQQKDAYIIVLSKAGKVNAIYMTGEGSRKMSGPIKVNDNATNLYNSYSMNTEPHFEVNQKAYHFELSDFDTKTQALIQFDDIYTQVFIDQQRNKIQGIRFLDKEALADINPYSEQNDDPLTKEELDQEAERQTADQTKNQLLTLYDLTNEMRKLNHREPLRVNATLENVATVDLFDVVDGGSAEFKEGRLTDLVNQTRLDYQTVSQNVGYNFNDVPTVVHGWINSDTHRSRMLNKLYDEMGGEVDRHYYMLIFLEKGEDDRV